MARIGFIGLGNMGLPMAQNLIKAGHQVEGVDVNPAAIAKLTAAGGASVETAKSAASRADVVITMLPSGKEVRDVYLGSSGIIESANAGTLLIDCSTIDVETARAVAAAGGEEGPVDARRAGFGRRRRGDRGTLTFMVGGSAQAFARAQSILEKMGKTIVHAGGAGNGQAAKICNNMILGISMIAVSRSFRARREARSRSSKVVRHFFKVVGPMLVADDLLSGTGTGSDIARQSRLSGGFHRSDDAEGFETVAGGGESDRSQDRTGADAAANLYATLCRERRRPARDFSGIIRSFVVNSRRTWMRACLAVNERLSRVSDRTNC